MFNRALFNQIVFNEQIEKEVLLFNTISLLSASRYVILLKAIQKVKMENFGTIKINLQRWK